MHNSKNIATVRTALPAAWATLITYLAAKFGLNISDDDMAVLIAVLPIVIPVFYRIFREVEVRFPRVGRLVFGTNMTPTYPDAPEGGV